MSVLPATVLNQPVLGLQELKQRPFLSIVAYDRFGRIHRGLFACHQRGYLLACHLAQGDGNF